MVYRGDEEHDTTTLAPNDYIMVKFASKKAIHHYVGMISETTDEFADEFEVIFLKCSKSVTAGSQSPTRYSTKKMMVLSVDLSQYCPQ